VWTTVNAGNANSLISSSFGSGYTTIAAVPKPGAGLSVPLS